MILAQNNSQTDYVDCAQVLCARIKQLMPQTHVTLLTDVPVSSGRFDQVRLFPHGDHCADQEWKLANDWQIYDSSPYEHTLKIEADIYLPRSIDHWWHTLCNHDLVLMTTIRNYTNAISQEKFYRRFITQNQLPDIYNAITYFKKSSTAQKFYLIVRDIFENWPQYLSILRDSGQTEPSTDFVYSLAAHIMGVEHCTLPAFSEFSMIHMKQMINGLSTHDWTDQLIYEIDPVSFRINTIPQLYPVHYHIKSFAHELSTRISA
jgi:hypothetical protein